MQTHVIPWVKSRPFKDIMRINPTTLIPRLIKHARMVMSVLGKGHSERVYHRSMISCLNRAGVAHRSEVLTPVYFLGEIVGFGRCDLIVGRLVVEFKANKTPPRKVSSQLDKYLEAQLAAEGVSYQGVVINFNQKSGKVEIFQPPSRKDHRVKKACLRCHVCDNSSSRPSSRSRSP